MQDARETVRGAKLYFCSQTEIQERYEVTMNQIYLEMNHIKKTFGELEVLKDISLSVHKGEVVSVIGPSGSGKTTLMNIIGCMDRSEAACIDYGWTAVAKTSRIARKPIFARVNRRKYCPFCSGSFRAICR